MFWLESISDELCLPLPLMGLIFLWRLNFLLLVSCILWFGVESWLLEEDFLFLYLLELEL